ncbi:MAG: hypothetical protein R3F62_11885, partial [Planctomycetota bacterium]
MKVGTRVGGEFVLEEELGQGVLGRTFRARRGTAGRQVVLKVLDTEDYAYLLKTRYGETHVNAMDTARLRGFERVFLEDGHGYLLAGKHYERSLAARLSEGPLELTECAQILLPVLDTVDALHARGRAHGWIKPQNVLLDPKYGVVLSDCGHLPVAQRLEPEQFRAFLEARPADAAFLPEGTPEATFARDAFAVRALILECLPPDARARFAEDAEERADLARLRQALEACLPDPAETPLAAPAAALEPSVVAAAEPASVDVADDDSDLDLSGPALLDDVDSEPPSPQEVAAAAPDDASLFLDLDGDVLMDDLLKEIDDLPLDGDGEETGGLTGVMNVPDVILSGDDVAGALLGAGGSNLEERRALRALRHEPGSD